MNVYGALVEAFGRRLREERLSRSESQEEFARWGNVSKNSQLNYENGKTPPTVEYLVRLQTYGVDIGYLITGRRDNGDLGQRDRWLIDAFDALSQRERDAVMQLMATLAGRVLNLPETASEAGATVHSLRREFQGQ